MNVLFLMQTYININVADAMYNSLVSEFIFYGHQVTVVASNEGHGSTILTTEGKAEVLRVRTLPFMNIPNFVKGLANILLPLHYRLAIRQHLKNRTYDLIVTPTPPITLTSLAKQCKKEYNAKLLLVLRDIFPQNAVDLGLINPRGFIYRYFRKMEKELYSCSDAIGCMTEGNINYVIKNNPGIDPLKLHLIPNWIKPGLVLRNNDNTLIQDLGLTDKFIVIYGGNLGLPQKVENIVEFSKIHQDKKDLVFLVVGKGTHKRRLEQLITREKISNVRLIDFLKRTEYDSLVSKSHVGFISLNENFTIPNIPYKTLSYYNFKKPVFAIIDSNTDYGKMIEEDESGFYCINGDLAGYYEKFNKLYYNSELREKMGGNGYNALINKYTPQCAYRKIAEIMDFEILAKVSCL